LHGQTGIALRAPGAIEDDPGDHAPATPTAALLPCLDPTPMGWKRRDWFLGIDQQHVFDRNGNIGPTLWWDGEIVGSWGITPAGELRLKVIADRGAAAHAALEDAASRLHERLQGAVVTPAIHAPLERSHPLDARAALS
jgi:Winged helix DNA-binding domain